MELFRSRCRWLHTLIAAVFLITAIAVPVASAEMVGTDVLAAEQTAQDARARINAMLDRDDVRDQLIGSGVDPAHARDRVAALSDAEARQLAARMDEMPAGGSVVGAVVVVFLVLLFTDIMGWTDIFPFVNKTAR